MWSSTGERLATSDRHRVEARLHQRQLWFAGMGFDPELVTEEWWRLYGEAEDGVVAPRSLPTHAMPGTLSRFDLESMKVAEVWEYPAGEFPSPPTFVPRVGSDEPDDGYVLVVVHRDGNKELQLFDAVGVIHRQHRHAMLNVVQLGDWLTAYSLSGAIGRDEVGTSGF